MRPVLQKSYLVALNLLLFMAVSVLSAQERKNDSIVQIETYRQQAYEAMSNQDFDTAVLELNKANKLAARIQDIPAKIAVRLHTAELHYYLRSRNAG